MKLSPTVLALFLLLVAMPATSPYAEGQRKLEEDEVRAQIILNLPLVATWPDGVLEGEQVRLCSISEEETGRYLQAMSAQPANAAHVAYESRVATDDVSDCNLLFIGIRDDKAAEAILQSVAGRPVLTIGTGKGFIRRGGMIGFLSAEKNIGLFSEKNVKFEINLKETAATGIVLDPLLLELAEKIIPAAGEGRAP